MEEQTDSLQTINQGQIPVYVINKLVLSHANRKIMDSSKANSFVLECFMFLNENMFQIWDEVKKKKVLKSLYGGSGKKKGFEGPSG